MRETYTDQVGSWMIDANFRRSTLQDRRSDQNLIVSRLYTGRRRRRRADLRGSSCCVRREDLQGEFARWPQVVGSRARRPCVSRSRSLRFVGSAAYLLS